jgi:hypothetical protein
MTKKKKFNNVGIRELQLLVLSLGIDPGNVRVEILVKNSAQVPMTSHTLLGRVFNFKLGCSAVMLAPMLCIY